MKERVNFTIDSEVMDFIRDCAKKENRTVSNKMQDIFIKYMETYNK